MQMSRVVALTVLALAPCHAAQEPNCNGISLTTTPIPAPLQHTWNGPFQWESYSGSVQLTLFDKSYVMDARVNIQGNIIPVSLPYCLTDVRVATSGPNITVNASSTYTGNTATGRLPNECITFVYTNTSVPVLRSGQRTVPVYNNTANTTAYEGVCVETVPLQGNANISVSTYQLNAASGASLSMLILPVCPSPPPTLYTNK